MRVVLKVLLLVPAAVLIVSGQLKLWSPDQAAASIATALEIEFGLSRNLILFGSAAELISGASLLAFPKSGLSVAAATSMVGVLWFVAGGLAMVYGMDYDSCGCLGSLVVPGGMWASALLLTLSTACLIVRVRVGRSGSIRTGGRRRTVLTSLVVAIVASSGPSARASEELQELQRTLEAAEARLDRCHVQYWEIQVLESGEHQPVHRVRQFDYWMNRPRSRVVVRELKPQEPMDLAEFLTSDNTVKTERLVSLTSSLQPSVYIVSDGSRCYALYPSPNPRKYLGTMNADTNELHLRPLFLRSTSWVGGQWLSRSLARSDGAIRVRTLDHGVKRMWVSLSESASLGDTSPMTCLEVDWREGGADLRVSRLAVFRCTREQLMQSLDSGASTLVGAVGVETAVASEVVATDWREHLVPSVSVSRSDSTPIVSYYLVGSYSVPAEFDGDAFSLVHLPLELRGGQAEGALVDAVSRNLRVLGTWTGPLPTTVPREPVVRQHDSGRSTLSLAFFGLGALAFSIGVILYVRARRLGRS